jgi:hypothetical protein
MMSQMKSAGLALAIAMVPLAALAQANVERAYAECRRQLAGVEEGAGTGNPIREQAIQGCVQQKLRQMQSGQPKK